MDSQYVPTPAFAAAEPSSTTAIPEEEEYYSSWSLFLVCALLILSLWTSYYLQIKRIRAIHETLVAIGAGMFVGLVVRLAPGTEIREMLVSVLCVYLALCLPASMLHSHCDASLHFNGVLCASTPSRFHRGVRYTANVYDTCR